MQGAKSRSNPMSFFDNDEKSPSPVERGKENMPVETGTNNERAQTPIWRARQNNPRNCGQPLLD
jgi:hypothetical protein